MRNIFRSVNTGNGWSEPEVIHSDKSPEEHARTVHNDVYNNSDDWYVHVMSPRSAYLRHRDGTVSVNWYRRIN